MKRRLVDMIGKTGFYVNFGPFHSFCSDVITDNPEFFPIERDSEPLTDILRYQLFQEIISDLPIKLLKPINRQFLFIKDIISNISNLKREGIGVKEFQTVVTNEFKSKPKNLSDIAELKFEKDKIKNNELLRINREYEKRLKKSHRFDFDDMIMFVGEAFKSNRELLLQYQEKIHYFLVDEYQDTNNGQNKVVNLLASYWGSKANIFVVGDPQQSIFRFQGASVENTLDFIKQYPKANIINLDQSYRCSQTILQAANQISQHNESTKNLNNKLLNQYFQQSIENKNNHGDKINLNCFINQENEFIYIAKKIKEIISNDKANLDDIAVLYRNNDEAELIKLIFDKFDIAWQIDAGINIIEHEAIRQLLVLFEVILDQQKGSSSHKTFELLCYDWVDVDKLSVLKLANFAGRRKQSIEHLLNQGYKTDYQTVGIGEKHFKEIKYFIKKLQQLRIDDGKLIFTSWFEKAINDSGYLDFITQQDDRLEIITVVNKLYNQIKSLVADNHGLKLDQFINIIRLLKEYRIDLVSDEIITGDGVHLSTVHKAKGQEWDYVFITGFIDGKWGNSRKHNMINLPSGIFKYSDLTKIEKNEDERRLFYVALTRAKKQVFISYPLNQIKNQKISENVPSMLVMEINPDLIIENKHEDTKADFKNKLIMLKPRVNRKVSIPDKDYFKRLIADFKLSPTALDTYLRNTNEFVENILLKVPKAKAEHMAFGTAIHKALEYYYHHFKKFNKPANIKSVHRIYQLALEKELIEYSDLKRRLTYGFEVLEKYHQVNQTNINKILMIEQKFGNGLNTVTLDDIYLSGRIDRIDLLDSNNKYVKVIDYKTGKNRSVNEIEGKVNNKDFSEVEKKLPASIKGSYKRQLLFYKLLFQLHPGFNFEAVHGQFDFVEPDSRTGKLIKRDFELHQADVRDLKDLIKQVMSEIRALKFLEEYYQK